MYVVTAVLVASNVRIETTSRREAERVAKALENMGPISTSKMVGHHCHPLVETRTQEKKRIEGAKRYYEGVSAANAAGEPACYSYDVQTCYGCGMCEAGCKLAGVTTD